MFLSLKHFTLNTESWHHDVHVLFCDVSYDVRRMHWHVNNKIKRKFTLFQWMPTKFSSRVMKTFKFSLVLCTRKTTDVFITLEEYIYCIHSKRVNILYFVFLYKNICSVYSWEAPEVLLMSTQNICFQGETRKYQYKFSWKWCLKLLTLKTTYMAVRVNVVTMRADGCKLMTWTASFAEVRTYHWHFWYLYEPASRCFLFQSIMKGMAKTLKYQAKL